jgi:hypothetical protein
LRICIDTVIFIDILKDEFLQNQEKFYQSLETGETLITSVINIAELMPMFHGNRKELSRFLKDHRIKVMELDIESTLVASERWIRYLKRKKVRHCPSCNTPIAGRDKILTDFFIGGFALIHCDKILTRDRGIYKTYFNDLKKL